MVRAERRRVEKKLRTYKALPTDERLTASSGIGVLVEIFYKSPSLQAGFHQIRPSCTFGGVIPARTKR